MMISRKSSMNRYISVIHRKFQNFLNKELEACNINSSEFMYLTALDNHGEMTLTEISDVLCMDNAQTTRIIQKLRDRGLVNKVRNKEDRREFKVELTENGKNTIPVIKSALMRWNNLITKGMSKEEVEELTEKLRGITLKVLEEMEGEKI